MSDRASVPEPARSLDRRTFVALSGAASAVAGSLTPTLAQVEGLGRPHPPLVAEDDPAISVARPQIRRANRILESYYAAPRTAAPTTPAVVVVQHVWGVDAQLRDTVRRFAKEGYIALAPDLYSGLGAPNGDGSTDIALFRPFADKLSDDVVDADLAAAAAFISAGAGGARQKIGVVGFCMGGSIALRQTVDSTGTFAAAAVFYGKVRYGTTGNNGAITPIALAYADRIGTPLCGSWGANDTSILAADVRALEARLQQTNKPHDVRVYDGAGHAFFDDTRASYGPNAASDAWTRTLAWFKQYLT